MYRRMDSIPLATRVYIRHQLRPVFHGIRDLERCMIVDDLSADGAIVEVDRYIAELRAIRRMLGGTDETATASTQEGGDHRGNAADDAGDA